MRVADTSAPAVRAFDEHVTVADPFAALYQAV